MLKMANSNFCTGPFDNEVGHWPPGPPLIEHCAVSIKHVALIACVKPQFKTAHTDGYSRTCVKRPLSKRQKISFRSDLGFVQF